MKRLENPKVKTRDWEGAARMTVCGVEEMRAADSQRKGLGKPEMGKRVMS